MTGAAPAAGGREGLALLAGITLFWGMNWPAMKLAVAGIEPWTFRALCLAAGVVGVAAAARGRGLAVPLRLVPALVAASLTNITAWHLFTGFGLTLIEAGRGSVIAFTMPLWVVPISAVALGERPTPRRLAGLALGLAALVLLVLPDAARLGAAPWGALLMLGAAVSWAAGTVIVKAVAWPLDALRLTFWQFLIGGLPVAAGAAVLGEPSTLLSAPASSLAGALYAATIPTVFCQVAYFRVVRLFPANVAALGVIAVPVVGVLSSALVLGEPVGPAEAASLALVVAGLALVLIRRDQTRTGPSGGSGSG